MQRKAQAAMEFLMTYGWAILAAVIAIAALAYFGVFSPARYMPNVCTINSPLGCDEYSIDSTTGITIVLRNGAGDSVDISSFQVGNCAPIVVGIIPDGGTNTTVSLAGCGTLTAGDKYKGDITVEYTKGSGTLLQTVTGTISGKIA